MHRHTAALSAAVILLQGFGTGLPASKLIPRSTVRSAAAFCTMLHAAPETDAEPFEELRYDPAADQILCDGRPVGKSYGGFTVTEGKLTADSGSGGQLTTEQAAESMGCGIVTEADGSQTVHSPFQTARLVVKSSGTVNPQGGMITAEGYNDLHVIQYETPQDAYRTYLAYQADSSISFVQPDRVRRVDETAVPETEPASDMGDMDSDFWGYEAIGTADYLAWLGEHHPEPPEITVAVLDTGIYAAHSWFQGRIRENGIDCTDSSVYSLDDRQGHGTHCAGIICRSTPESVKILPVKVISDDGYGSDLMIYCGIMYAVEQKADVISMSLGGDGDAPLMMEGIKAAAEADIPVCVAAGNEAYDADYSAPGCYETVFCISAVGYDYRGLISPDYSDLSRYCLCSFSNRGVEIDFAAPGSEIISAGISSPDNLTFMSGTSMAAPFAAAACADLLSADSDLTTAQIRRMLHNLAIKLPAPDDLDIPAADCYGSGLINLRGAFVTGEYVAPPVITVTGGRISGTYCEATESVSITITAQKQDDPVYYTTDGSEPDAMHGTLYTGEFTLHKSAVIRAAVIRSDAFSKSDAVSVCIGGNEIEADPYTVEDGVLTAYNGVLRELDMSKDFAEGFLHAIGDRAFMFSNLKSVTLPDS
ncbi:MAG: S8 family serine peptidase, partial [Oscillospiraceae bacterium]|nr:S8 family serine peptidase [Oscillospiraceae bacterium]